MKCNQSRPGFELVSPCSFPTAITTTPRAPPVVWMVSVRRLISKSSSPRTSPLVTVPSMLITIGKTVTFIFLRFFFFSSLARSRYLSLFSLSLSFTLWSAKMVKSTIRQVLTFLGGWGVIITRSDCLSEIRLSICILKSHRILCASFFRMDSPILSQNVAWMFDIDNFIVIYVISRIRMIKADIQRECWFFENYHLVYKFQWEFIPFVCMVKFKPLAQTGVQSQFESYQRLKKWYLIPPCLTLSITKWGSRVKLSNPRNGVAPSPTPRCSSFGSPSTKVTNFTFYLLSFILSDFRRRA